MTIQERFEEIIDLEEQIRLINIEIGNITNDFGLQPADTVEIDVVDMILSLTKHKLALEEKITSHQEEISERKESILNDLILINIYRLQITYKGISYRIRRAAKEVDNGLYSTNVETLEFSII